MSNSGASAAGSARTVKTTKSGRTVASDNQDKSQQDVVSRAPSAKTVKTNKSVRTVLPEDEEKMQHEVFYDNEPMTKAQSTAACGTRGSEEGITSPLALAARRKCRARKKPKICIGRTQLLCEDDPQWRTYMKLFVEEIKDREKREKEEYGEFPRKRQRPPNYPRLPCPLGIPKTPELPARFELNAFNLTNCWLGGTPAALVWQCLPRSPTKADISEISITCSSEFEWPTLYPCSKRDPIREKRIYKRKMKMKKIGALPCEIEAIDSPESSDDEKLQELANLKELGHARIPPTAHKTDFIGFIEREAGDRPGLVEGDCYALVGLKSRKASRSLASVSLRGLVGMHLPELERTRHKTWKFCMFQALVALLVKTQLRYKFAWSANIDYIYQHAWLLFLHMGYLNTKRNQRFDDILVYNYKYSVELELIHELEDVPVVPKVSFKFMEKALQCQSLRARKELTLTQSYFGCETVKDRYNLFVHNGTKAIEKWFQELDFQYTNCVIRVSKFALAFWQDGPFWYVYNPYRCDKFGLWNDMGAACITKFCTRDGLKRHLMILILRAYAYRTGEKTEEQIDRDNRDKFGCPKDPEKFTVQIYQMIFHSCKIHNVKLYLRGARKPKTQLVEKKKSDPCTYDPLANLSPLSCEEKVKVKEKEKLEELEDKMERPYWVQNKKINWSRIPPKETECKIKNDIPRWHNFQVIEPRRLYVLWGDLHITDRIFAEENRSRQFGTCYAVCAGMSLINAPEYWGPDILNAIVVCGDKFYTARQKTLCKRRNGPLTELDDDWDSRPSDHFRISDTLFDIIALPSIQGQLYVRTDGCLWRTLEGFFHCHRFGILACESVRVAVFKHCGAYYMCDVRSYGPPIFERGSGSAYLLRTSCFVDLVTCLVLLIGSPECSKFKLRPVEIVKVVDIEGAECGRQKCKTEKKCDVDEKTTKVACPFEDDKRKAKRKGRRSELEKNMERTVCTNKEEPNGCKMNSKT